MSPRERPIVFGRSGAFAIDIPDVETVIIANTTREWVSFVFMVVPSFVAGAAVFPWRRFLEQLRAPEGVLKAGRALLYQLQQQYLDPRSRAHDLLGRRGNPIPDPEDE